MEEPPPVPKAPILSIKEQIALKRAEASKAKPSQPSGGSGGLDLDGLEEALPEPELQDNLDLGRWSVKETIERARSSGMYGKPLLVDLNASWKRLKARCKHSGLLCTGQSDVLLSKMHRLGWLVSIVYGMLSV